MITDFRDDLIAVFVDKMNALIVWRRVVTPFKLLDFEPAQFKFINEVMGQAVLVSDYVGL